MTFDERLIQLRKAKGLSQEELGFQLGVTRQTVSKWELGQSTPEMHKLIEISKFFAVSIDKLAGNETEEKEDKSHIASSRTFHYEYKSSRTLFGLPLVHVNIGPGIFKAKGVIAIGTIAKGIISLGAISFGVISLGVISVGMLALGAVGLGITAIAGIAVGALAVGGIAVGLLAIGGVAFGIHSI